MYCVVWGSLKAVRIKEKKSVISSLSVYYFFFSILLEINRSTSYRHHSKILSGVIFGLLNNFSKNKKLNTSNSHVLGMESMSSHSQNSMLIKYE